jgi:GT2 family glycosyltransferase
MTASSTEPLTSIVIPNYNGSAYLPECLDSLHEQSFKPLDIIVVDNGSTDGSVALLERDYPNVRLVRLASNRGFAAAVNAGIDAARGGDIVLLNNDTRCEPDFVRELYQALRNMPDASMAAPKMLFARAPETINSMGLGYGIAGTNHDIGFGLKDGPQFQKQEWIFGPCGGAGMYRRTAFDNVGRFDEDFFMYYEDVDFSFRAQLAGHKCITVPTARVYHAEGGSAGTLPKPKNYYFARNSLLVIIKNFPMRLILKYIFTLKWELLKRAGSPLRKGDTSALIGYCAALGSIGSALKKRREVQKLKKVDDSYIEAILVKNRSLARQINLRGRPGEEPA